jgi:phasin family protein
MSDLPQFPMDITKYFTSLSMLPAFPEVTALLEVQKRNLATLAAANKLLFEGAQAITQRQVEVVRRQVADATEAARVLATTVNPQERTLRQTELVKTAYEKSISDLKEIEDLLRKSSGEALELVHSRFLEAVDEVKAAVEKKTPAA